MIPYFSLTKVPCSKRHKTSLSVWRQFINFLYFDFYLYTANAAHCVHFTARIFVLLVNLMLCFRFWRSARSGLIKVNANWIEWNWIEFNWIGLDRIGSDRIELNWIELESDRKDSQMLLRSIVVYCFNLYSEIEGIDCATITIYIPSLVLICSIYFIKTVYG